MILTVGIRAPYTSSQSHYTPAFAYVCQPTALDCVDEGFRVQSAEAWALRHDRVRGVSPGKTRGLRVPGRAGPGGHDALAAGAGDGIGIESLKR